MFEALKSKFGMFGWRKSFIWLAIALVLLGIGYVFQSDDFDSFIKQLPFTNSANAGWLNGKFAYFVLASLVVAIGCPRQVISFFAAYFFGLLQGVLIGLAATTLACVISFFIARVFKTYFKDMLKGKLKLAFEFWKQNTFLATLIWRFIPAGSNLLTNLVAGAFGISALPFIMGSALGYIPHTVVFALLGAGVDVGSNFQLIASALLFVVSILLGLILYKKYQTEFSPNA